MISLQHHKFLKKNTSVGNFLGIYDGRELRTKRKEIIEEISERSLDRLVGIWIE